MAVLLFGCAVGADTMEWIRELFRIARHDTWISVLLALAISLPVGALVVRAVSLYPEAPPGGIFRSALGTWLGGLFALGFAFYTLAQAARACRTAVELLHFAVLPRTPTWVLAALGLLITAVLLQGGIDAVLRFQFALFWPTLLLAAASLAHGLRAADWGNLLPVLAHGFAPLLRGQRAAMEPVVGLELGLIFLPYYLRKGMGRQSALRALWMGTAAVFAFYLYVAISLQVGFGPYDVAEMTWPLMEATRRTFLTGLFFERLDILFLISLLITVATAQNLFVYAGLQTLRQTFSLRPSPWQGWASLLLVLAMALFPQNLTEVDWWRSQVVLPLGLVYLILVPPLLISVGRIRRQRRGSHAQQT